MSALPTPHNCLTVPEYAHRLGISAAQVRGYIERGELEAIDTSERGPVGTRPRWKIPPEAIERFERRRSSLVRRAVETAPQIRKPEGSPATSEAHTATADFAGRPRR